MQEPLEFDGVYYNSFGEEVEKDDPAICAKHLISNRTGNSFYTIKMCSKGIFDPTIDGSIYRKYPWKFLKVPVEKFNYYVSFLKTRQKRFLTQAERMI